MTHPAYALAEELKNALARGCVRIALAGSLRRGKAQPKDIELVAIPLTGVYEVKDMFDFVTERHPVNHLDDALTALLAAGVWQLDPVVKRNGPNYKRLVHGPSAIACVCSSPPRASGASSTPYGPAVETTPSRWYLSRCARECLSSTGCSTIIRPSTTTTAA